MVCCGIDVSKSSLSCCIGTEVREFPNSEAGLEELVSFAHGADLWLMEATGRYHVKAAIAALKAGSRCVVVNPGQAKKYLSFVSGRAKTDTLDAKALARLGEAEGDRLREYVPVPEWVSELRDLMVGRRGLIESRVALEQIAGSTGDPDGHLEMAIGGIKAAQAKLEKTLHQKLASQARYQDLLSIPGIGPMSAALTLCALERGEFATSDSLVAYAGLDPRASDSGQKKGRRALSHQGDAALRTTLFMAARAGSRMPAWKDYYAKQRAKGFSTTEATVILSRKMLRVAWAVYKQGKPFIQKEQPNSLDKTT
jgi:transposase